MSSSSGHAILQALPFAALLLDEHRVVLDVNDRFFEQLARSGTRRQSMVGKALADLGDFLDEGVLTLLSKVRSGDRLNIEGVTLWRKAAQDEDDSAGLGMNLEMTLDACPAGNSASLVVFARTSAADTLALDLKRADRLAGLGIVACGIAHDLNNQLSATLNIASLLRNELGSGSEHDQALEIIEGSAREAADLGRRLLHYAGRGQPTIEDVPLRAVIDDALLLVRHSLPPGDRLIVNVEADLGVVRGDPAQLEQVAVTLLLTCAATVRHAGTLHVAGTKVPLDTSHARVPSGTYARLTFETDDASAAEPETSLAGDPVEPHDRMALIRSIVDSHGGVLECDPCGAHLVFLPLGSSSRPAKHRETTMPSQAPDGRRTILVVDDDQMVREVATAMLEKLDYRAIACADGPAAIAALTRADSDVDAVILDLVMAGMDGVTTLRRMRDNDVVIKVLVSSGLGSELHNVPKELDVDGILEKPYTIATLRDALDTMFAR